MELCKGNSFCNDAKDLQWCKNDTSWDQSIPFDWKPIYEHFMCTLKPQQDVFAPHGQWIKGSLIAASISILKEMQLESCILSKV